MKKGYILLEGIISLSIIVIISICLCQVIATLGDAKENIEARVELSQQLQEIDYQIKSLVEEATDIINITTRDKIVVDNLEYGRLYNVTSIKLNLKIDENKSDASLKNKEISLKTDKNKLFINNLNNYNSSESGGYEIGDYVEKIYLKRDNPKLISIVFHLKKDNVTLKEEMKLYIRYDSTA